MNRTSTDLPAGHPPVAHGRIGVLIVNLGTPDAADTASVRRYLREFLSDRRVIEASPLLWRVILEAFILPFRPKRSAAAYRAIWNTARDESPLRTVTRDQAEALAGRFARRDGRILVDHAMRYGSPAIAERLGALVEQGCERVLLCPLYPQYSATTTASVQDEAFRALMTMRRQPAIRTLPPWHDEPDYIAALAGSVRREIAARGREPEVILASFHGLPRAYLEAGDPYYCHCSKTARLLRAALGRDETSLRMTFQSRFGPKQWLQPYTDATLTGLAGEGVRDVMLITPGFVADCLETLEEIAIGSREVFLGAGGEHFTLVPCLNADEAHVDLLEKLIGRELSGWLG